MFRKIVYAAALASALGFTGVEAAPPGCSTLLSQSYTPGVGGYVARSGVGGGYVGFCLTVLDGGGAAVAQKQLWVEASANLTTGAVDLAIWHCNVGNLNCPTLLKEGLEVREVPCGSGTVSECRTVNVRNPLFDPLNLGTYGVSASASAPQPWGTICPGVCVNGVRWNIGSLHIFDRSVPLCLVVSDTPGCPTII